MGDFVLNCSNQATAIPLPALASAHQREVVGQRWCKLSRQRFSVLP